MHNLFVTFMKLTHKLLFLFWSWWSSSLLIGPVMKFIHSRSSFPRNWSPIFCHTHEVNPPCVLMSCSFHSSTIIHHFHSVHPQSSVTPLQSFQQFSNEEILQILDEVDDLRRRQEELLSTFNGTEQNPAVSCPMLYQLNPGLEDGESWNHSVNLFEWNLTNFDLRVQHSTSGLHSRSQNANHCHLNR